MELTDFLSLKGIDYVEFYVGNAKQAAYFYCTAFGFQPLAYSGLETGNTDRASYAVQQGKAVLVFSTALHSESGIGEHVKKHGDGAKVIALAVDDARKAYKEVVQRGAKSTLEPTVLSDNNGEAVVAAIQIYGETEHYFVERNAYKGAFMPGYKKWATEYQPPDTGLVTIDHIVGNQDWNQMDTWTEFYRNVMGFQQLISFDDKDISTDYTALKSKVMASPNWRVKFPINEPAGGKKKSQIEEYINFYEGPGVQHVALATHDIVKTVSALKQRGVDFLYVPGNYYDTVTERCGKIDEDLQVLKDLHILVDRDDDGYLLQIFTKPLQDRPTVFFEIIQRKGAKSFGKGNFKALFESIEEEQRKRGTL